MLLMLWNLIETHKAGFSAGLVMSVGTLDSSRQLSKTITQMTICSNLLTPGARQSYFRVA